MLAEIERQLAERAEGLQKLDEIGKAADASASEAPDGSPGRSGGTRKRKGVVIAIEADSALYAQLQHVQQAMGYRSLRETVVESAKAGMRTLLATRRR